MKSPDESLPISVHMRELRMRVLVSLSSILICTAALMPFASHFSLFLARPLISALPEGTRLVVLTPFEAWYAYFKIAIIGGFVLSLPVIFSQIFAFASPAINKSMKYAALISGVFAGVLFIAGAAFCYLLVLPAGFKWAIKFTDVMGAVIMPRLESYISLALGLITAFGLAFELPLLVAMLIGFGIVSRKACAKARPYAIVGAFIVGALLTPPDVVSQTALAIPLILLYELGILLGCLFLAMKRTKADDKCLTNP